MIEVYKRDVDVALIRENLRLTLEQRVEKIIAVTKFVEELRRWLRGALALGCVSALPSCSQSAPTTTQRS